MLANQKKQKDGFLSVFFCCRLYMQAIEKPQKRFCFSGKKGGKKQIINFLTKLQKTVAIFFG